MAITNAFKEAVASGNVKGVRIMIKDSMLVDPTFTDYNEMKRLSANMRGLYNSHDGREFISDKSEWNDDYMDKLMVQVVGNFSKERLEHLQSVVRHLRPAPKTTPKPNVSKPNTPRTTGRVSIGYEEQKKRDQLDGNYRGAKIAGGVVVGAVVGGAVAVIASAPAIGGAVIGAAVGGAVAAVATSGGE